jgi:hypothetical protein
VVNYRDVRHLIPNGALLVKRGRGMIADVGRNPAKHVGLAVWRHSDQSSLSIAESREWYGSRVVSFREQVRRDAGSWDVYEPVGCFQEHAYRAATIAYNWAGHDYDYPGCLAIYVSENPHLLRLARLLGWDLLERLTDETPSEWADPKKCSGLVAWSYRWAALELAAEGVCPSKLQFNPCPQLNDRYVQPADLVRSGCWNRILEGLTVNDPPVIVGTKLSPEQRAELRREWNEVHASANSDPAKLRIHR